MPKKRKTRKRSKIKSNARMEELLYPIKKKVENNPIFVVDTIGDINKKMKWRTKLLTSHKILGINETKTKISKSHDALIKREVKKLEKNPKVEIDKKPKKNKRVASFDLWEDEQKDANDWIDDSINPKRNPSRDNYKPTGVKAIEKPTTKASYNPSFESHQQSMGEVIALAINEKKKEIGLINKVRVDKELSNLKDKNRDERITQIKKELENEANKSNDKQEIQNEEATNDDPIKRVTKKKTEKKRRQKKRRTLKRISKMREKLRKSDGFDEEKLVKIHQNVEKDLQYRKLILKLKRLKKQRLNKVKTKRLGPIKFKNQIDTDAVLTSDQLTGSIRTIPKPKSLILNTFVNLQKRNIIEPRNRVDRPRASKKVVRIFGKKKEWHDMEKILTKDIEN